MISRKAAQKTLVLDKLDASIRYCNSHRDNVQDLFDALVEEQINPFCRPSDYERRSAEMKALFPVVTVPETHGFIPSIKIYEDELSLDPHEFLEIWLTRWVAKFVRAWEKLPSQRCAKPKSAVTDYALIAMVSSHAGSEQEAAQWVSQHNLFMSAENIGGNLLEEYIAERIAPYGWIWCRGEILTAVDFCNDACTEFVQVKNKSNTENSSGKGFREDHKAPVWFRMYANKRNGKVVTRWDDLMEIVLRGATRNADEIPDDLLNEKDYLAFLHKVAQDNPLLITDEEK